MVGVTTVWGIVLKGCSIRMNYWSRDLWWQVVQQTPDLWHR